MIAIILTLNEERHIEDCIKSINWAENILVLDAFSTDKTVQIARSNGADVRQYTWVDFAYQRNLALELAPEGEWVLFVDADERVTPELAREIQETIQRGGPQAGWWIPRWNYIMGHKMRGAGWRPDYQLRLLKQGKAHYAPERKVHEIVELDGDAGYLQASLLHYNYDTLKQFRTKQRQYLIYDIQVLLEANVKPKWYTPYSQLIRHFFWRFLHLHGWRDHVYGLLLSGLMAWYQFLKYRHVYRDQNDTDTAQFGAKP